VLGRTLASLVDLVLPADCAGCGGAAGLSGICEACAAVLAQPPGPTRPTPAPEALPPCVCTGEYAGPLRELILTYKERGRRSLAAPLGDTLAAAVQSGCGVSVTRSTRPSGPIALVPIPATPAAIRARHGDHMLRLAKRAALSLRRAGLPAAVVTPLRALPKPDAASLDREARAQAAREAFATRSGRAEDLRAVADAGVVVLLDDVVTTGATLAAAARCLSDAGVPVAFAATLAATRLRRDEQARSSRDEQARSSRDEQARRRPAK
jgi:predicted amidophosphoribosyltransferase